MDYATELIAEVRTSCKDPIILLEQRLDYSCYAPEGFGAGDLVIITDGALDIVDLKYGKGVVVSAEGNPQMKLYALGALALFDSLYDIIKKEDLYYERVAINSSPKKGPWQYCINT